MNTPHAVLLALLERYPVVKLFVLAERATLPSRVLDEARREAATRTAALGLEAPLPPIVVLDIGLNMPVPIPGLLVDERGVRGTFSFSRQPFDVVCPWRSLISFGVEDVGGWSFEMAYLDSLPGDEPPPKPKLRAV